MTTTEAKKLTPGTLVSLEVNVTDKPFGADMMVTVARVTRLAAGFVLVQCADRHSSDGYSKAETACYADDLTLVQEGK